MRLAEELGFVKDFEDSSHEALLSIYHTASLARKKSAEFFQTYGITDVQFNLLMLLRYQSDNRGLRQVALGRTTLVNRASVTAMIDRMEKSGLVSRANVPDDRRSNYVRLTRKSLALLERIEERYKSEIDLIMKALSPQETTQLLDMLQRIRGNLRHVK